MVSSNRNLPPELPVLFGSKEVGWKVPEGFAGAVQKPLTHVSLPAHWLFDVHAVVEVVPVHSPGVRVNPLGVIAARVAGLSAIWMFVSSVFPLLQTFEVMGTVTTQPLLEQVRLLRPGLAQCFFMAMTELTLILHVADAGGPVEFMVWPPTIAVAVALLVRVVLVESKTIE